MNKFNWCCSHIHVQVRHDRHAYSTSPWFLTILLIAALQFSNAAATAQTDSNNQTKHQMKQGDQSTKKTLQQMTDMIGWQIFDAYSALGLPSHIFSVRGDQASEDNVVFYYPNHLYLFWFQDRVWQVRSDERWTDPLKGLKMGMNRKEVIKLWGQPINQIDKALTWNIEDRGFSIQARLYFDATGKLNDFYLFRADW